MGTGLNPSGGGGSWGDAWGGLWGGETAHPLRGGGIPGPGWNYKHWKKRKEREDELEQTIRAQWLKLTGNEPPAEIITEAKQEETKRETVEFVSYQAWDRFAFAQLEMILADLKAREDEDEEALLLLM